MNAGPGIQIQRFYDDSFVVHRITNVCFAGRISAWFDKNGVLLEAEQFRTPTARGSFRVIRGGPIWKSLEHIGRRHLTMASKYEKQPNDPDLTQSEKESLYDAGKYSCPPPPVHTTCWSRASWISFIDSCGVWHGKHSEKASNDT